MTISVGLANCDRFFPRLPAPLLRLPAVTAIPAGHLAIIAGVCFPFHRSVCAGVYPIKVRRDDYQEKAGTVDVFLVNPPDHVPDFPEKGLPVFFASVMRTSNLFDAGGILGWFSRQSFPATGSGSMPFACHQSRSLPEECSSR